MPVAPQGFEAWIEVEGRRLDEFKVEAEGNRVVCWVPCEPGKGFKIGCSIPAERVRDTNHSIRIDIDGTYAAVPSSFIYQDFNAFAPRTRQYGEQLASGATGGTVTRAFHFGNLELTDDDALLHAPAKSFGEIDVRVLSVERYIECTCNFPVVDRNYRVHERKKKGLSHCVKLGEEKPIGSEPFNKVRPVGEKKVCQFVFRYRKLDVLRADGIAPPQNRVASGSQIAEAALDKVKVEDDQIAQDILDPTDEDIETLEARLAAMKAKRARRVEAGEAEPPRKRIKREHKSTLISDEIIDLTDPAGSVTIVKRKPKAAFAPSEVIDLT